MSNKELVNQKRRAILGGAAVAVTGITIAPGVFLTETAQARPLDEPVSSKNRWGILVNTNNCNDCNVCVIACQEENGWGIGSTDEQKSRPDQKAQWIRTVKVTNKKTGYATTLPMFCQHCKNPPCVDVCPTGASFKRADGIVLVDKHICIGCRYCMMACPYKARSFIHEKLTDQRSYAPRGKGTVESCTLCVQRVDNGEDPACVEACSSSLIFGDLNDPDSKISKELARNGGTQIRADLRLDPGVIYQGLNI
ncbi:tetrathionate reductase subunit B precursor [bacterium BMS3Bbin11]|nr:tetrathionate reductase subunit B precursor [bacterium BMS3Abin11]GBE46667.1 tetrathionate reductase subunit B precursor [bacterium BMS3Bbin11]HDH17176.1 4Fe-4S dicluster domain-containing protein [Gammaproteobacteria bacterium]HDZ79280.1 4Fe-4S dicluster domain-containing protein [Gammaproteobacteria bacterium]